MSELQSDTNTIFKQMSITSSSTSEGDDDGIFDDYDDNFVDFISSNEDTDSSIQSVDPYHQVCMFSMTSLQRACQMAFEATAIEDRRPILVYIHNDESLYKQKFCKTLFYSTAIIDYLNMNYIVWPWDISSEFNRYTLTKIWQEMFSVEFFEEFPVVECPLLIGIMRLFAHKTDEGITSAYQYKLLVKGNTLIDTKMTIDRDNLLNELGDYKEKCDENEKDLSFNIVEKTGLPWEIIFEITQYLSLNDTIAAFSPNILPLLNKFAKNFRLSKPFDPLINMIYPRIQSKRVVSLHFHINQLLTTPELDFLCKFPNITSLTLHNPSYPSQITQYTECFEKLTRLSLFYEHNLTGDMLYNVVKPLKHQTKRLEIHCSGIFCDENYKRLETTSVEYLLIDIGHYRPPSNSNNLQYYRRFVATKFHFKQMPHIQYIHFIISKSDVEQFLDDYQWRTLINICRQLMKIRIQVLEEKNENKPYLIKKAQEIEKILRTVRPTIRFQISFV